MCACVQIVAGLEVLRLDAFSAVSCFSFDAMIIAIKLGLLKDCYV